MGVEHRYIEVNGLRLHAVDFGGLGQPLVTLHGVCEHAWIWRGVAGALANRRRILAVDLRGHGDSQWSPTESYETADHVKDLRLALSTSPEPVDLVGQAWGGLIALRLAVLAPELVRRIVIVDAPPSSPLGTADVPVTPQEFDDHAAVVAWERRENPVASDAMIEVLSSFGSHPAPHGKLSRKYDPVFTWRWPFHADDLWSDLKQVAVPTLLVRGERSTVLTPEIFDKMALAQPAAERVVVAEAGHRVPIDNPAGLASALGEFLA